MSHNKKGKHLKQKKQVVSQPAIPEVHEGLENNAKSTHFDRSGFRHK